MERKWKRWEKLKAYASKLYCEVIENSLILQPLTEAYILLKVKGNYKKKKTINKSYYKDKFGRNEKCKKQPERQKKGE